MSNIELGAVIESRRKTIFPPLRRRPERSVGIPPPMRQFAEFRAMFLSAVFKNPQIRHFFVFGTVFPRN